MGILPSTNSEPPLVDDYYLILDNILASNIPIPSNFIMTVGIISNHGNWFTSSNMNKELRVLANSFDWLLFLSDNGLTEFVEELLLEPRKDMQIVRDSFISTYSPDSKIRAFTKSKMPVMADLQLQKYFNNNSSFGFRN